MTNKIEMSTPKISLINNIGNPPNSPKKYTLSIAEPGANAYLENQATPTMDPVIISKYMTARLQDGI